jgi:hypothetical protein
MPTRNPLRNPADTSHCSEINRTRFREIFSALRTISSTFNKRENVFIVEEEEEALFLFAHFPLILFQFQSKLYPFFLIFL